jgi:cytochrome c553
MSAHRAMPVDDSAFVARLRHGAGRPGEIIAVVALLALAAPALAQDGAAIARQGAGPNAPACSSCHGANGEGNAAANFPRLAAQAAPYLVRQLDAYADGRRQNPIMTPIAKALDAKQRAAVAAHYAELPVATAAGTAASGAAGNGSANGTRAGTTSNDARASAPVKASASGQARTSATSGGRAERLATAGDERLQVQGCANCHGAGGRGEPPSYPYLATQHAGYLRDTLLAWKTGTRDTDPSGTMNRIAKQLPEADIAALAQYFAAQSAPDTLELTLAPGTMPPTGSVSAAGTPAQAGTAQPTRPAGVEQGSPTAGGSQGVGSGNQGQGTPPPGGGSPR